MNASVLICPYTKQTWGHLTRCFALADALVALGARVRFACPAEARPRVEGAGFELVELVSMDRQELLIPPRSARAAAAARRHFAGELRTVAACLGAIDPDIVVSDLQPLVNIAAALAAIPSASVQNLELLTTPLAWWLPGLERILGELEVPRWAARRVFGDTLIVADTPSITGLRDLPASMSERIAASVREVRFVGPILGDVPRWRLIAGRARPEVVVSLGGGRSAGAADIVAGSAAVDADFVIVAPRPSDELVRAADERRRAGKNVTIVDFLPDFAPRIATADALVTHGGHGTLSLALALAVPTLVVPTSAEQEINAKRLHGVGTVASPNPKTVRATIGDQLLALLRDRASDPVRARLADSLATYHGARDAALVVHRMAQHLPTEGSW
ncbi:MAG TPA: nucleotide disphospho-sugar-binding domain-containing protein [Kofleriaceae bacterium]|jgi:UDP:flavonoid glycosyltransferase YjiC (YdhE family)|nr:nucleotide disphospho-sugar-binding domain-containing protein [Kofleriaceae bacterium]